MDYNNSIFFYSNPSPMWIYDAETFKIVDVNNAAIEKYGYSKEEFLSLTIKDLRADKDIPRLKEHLQNTSLGFRKSGIWKHKTKDGTTFNVEITTESFEEKGKIYTIVFVKEIFDNSNIKNMPDLWSTQLQNHLKKTPLSYLEWGKELRIKNFSSDILDKYHFSFNDLYNKTPLDLIPFAVTDEDAELIKTRIREILNGKHTQSQFEMKFYDKHKNVVYSKWYNSVVRDVNNNVISILSLIEDITTQKAIENELKSQNQFVSSIISSLPGIFYMFDENGDYVRWNRNFEKLLNLTSEEFKKENLLDHYYAEEKALIREKLHEVLKKGETAFTAHIIAGDGSKPAFYLTGVRCMINGKKYIVGTGFDITDKEHIDQELKKSLHEKEVLLAEIHHRVKNNLAAISGLLELETYNVKNPQATQVLVNSMLRVRSIALIHEKLYQFKELSSIHVKNYIYELVETIIKTISTSVKIKLETDIEDLTMNVNQAIPTALILNELVTNSLEHAFPDMDTGILGISFKNVDDKFCLEVYDSGIGISPDILNNNTQTLGIKLIKTLARQLDADLTIHPDNGTRTCLRFVPGNNAGSVSD